MVVTADVILSLSSAPDHQVMILLLKTPWEKVLLVHILVDVFLESFFDEQMLHEKCSFWWMKMMNYGCWRLPEATATQNPPIKMSNNDKALQHVQ